jgi:hypothetical protein
MARSTAKNTRARVFRRVRVVWVGSRDSEERKKDEDCDAEGKAQRVPEGREDQEQQSRAAKTLRRWQSRLVRRGSAADEGQLQASLPLSSRRRRRTGARAVVLRGLRPVPPDGGRIGRSSTLGYRRRRLEGAASVPGGRRLERNPSRNPPTMMIVGPGVPSAAEPGLPSCRTEGQRRVLG